MKKAVLVLIFIGLVISLAYVVSAVEMSLGKDSYYPGETLQMQVGDVFIDSLETKNVGIYIQNGVHKTPVENGMIKYNSKYYYYAVLPTETGNYSLNIENINYREGGQVKTNAIVKNFTIKSTNSSYLSFNPGALYSSKEFSIKIIAYNEEQSIDISLEKADFTKTIRLGYENEQTINIPISGIKNLTFTNVEINSYKIPILISPDSNRTPIEENENISLKERIYAKPSSLNLTILKDFDYSYNVEITNKFNSSVSITLDTDNKAINITPRVINKFKGTEELIVTVRADKDVEANVIISSSNSSIKIPISIQITKDSNNVSSTVPEIHEGQTCSSIGGKECNTSIGEKCSGRKVYRTELKTGCCIGECKKVSSGSGWLWGLLIVILVIGIATFFYMKAKKEGKIDSIGSIFKKKTENYEKRMSPAPESVEVRKSLGNI